VVCSGDVVSPACEAKDAALTFHEPVAPHHARSGAASTRRGTHHAIGTARRCRPNPHACLRLITSAQLCSARGGAARPALAAMPLPGFVPPCLAIKAPQPPSGNTWVHEIKHDGFRLRSSRTGHGAQGLPPAGATVPPWLPAKSVRASNLPAGCALGPQAFATQYSCRREAYSDHSAWLPPRQGLPVRLDRAPQRTNTDGIGISNVC
jgi:hypothetical protein